MADLGLQLVGLARSLARKGQEWVRRKHKAAAPLAAGLFLVAGCQVFWPNSFLQASDDPCPWEAETAKAWVNKMPGVETGHPRLLHVYLRLKEQDKPVFLSRAPSSTESSLILQLDASDDERLGRAGASYRERPHDLPYSEIIIQCRAEQVARITSINTVW